MANGQVTGRHGRQAAGDMVRTAVVFAVILLAIGVFFPRGKHNAANQRVDYTAELQVVRNRAPFHVLAPQGLSRDWTATHVTIDVPGAKGNPAGTTSFDVGFYVDHPSAYVQLEQSNAAGWVRKQLGDKGKQAGQQHIAGQQWQSWTDSDGHPALVRTTPDGSTVVLDGQAPPAVLTTLAASLQ